MAGIDQTSEEFGNAWIVRKKWKRRVHQRRILVETIQDCMEKEGKPLFEAIKDLEELWASLHPNSIINLCNVLYEDRMMMMKRIEKLGPEELGRRRLARALL